MKERQRLFGYWPSLDHLANHHYPKNVAMLVYHESRHCESVEVEGYYASGHPYMLSVAF